jgi:hypothetical protein
MRDEQLILAWAAGFVDGEGYVGMQNSTHTYNRHTHFQGLMSVAQAKTDEPLQILSRLFGGKVTWRKNQGNGAYYWVLYGQKMAVCLRALLPYLVVKRRQAEVCLEYQETCWADSHGRYSPMPEEIQAKRLALYTELRALNIRRKVVRAERLSAPNPSAAPVQEYATVRSHAKRKRESQKETSGRLALFDIKKEVAS